MNYRVDGDPDLPLLVLSHGLGLDVTMWEPQMAALSREFRVLRYDTRGHGVTPSTGGAWTIEMFGRDVLDLLDRTGAERAHFCGFSMGGMIGIWLGIHAPSRLNKLVLAHTAARIGTRAMWDARIATVQAHGMCAISDAAMERWFTRDYLVKQPETVEALKHTFERTPADGYVQCAAAIRDGDFVDEVARIAAPTLVISGTMDAATTLADGRVLAHNIGGSEFSQIESAHLSNFERPSEFTAALLEFLRRQSA